MLLESKNYLAVSRENSTLSDFYLAVFKHCKKKPVPIMFSKGREIRAAKYERGFVALKKKEGDC